MRYAYAHAGHGVNRQARRASLKRARSLNTREAWEFAENLQRFKLTPAVRGTDKRGRPCYVPKPPRGK